CCGGRRAVRADDGMHCRTSKWRGTGHMLPGAIFLGGWASLLASVAAESALCCVCLGLDVTGVEASCRACHLPFSSPNSRPGCRACGDA
ncbi:MAG: hypothetical protein ACK55Z_28345, partial [bacterium]